MEQKLPLTITPALELERSLGGTLQTDNENRVLEQKPQGRDLTILKPSTTLQVAGSPRPDRSPRKKARRSLALGKKGISRARVDSASEESDFEDGDDNEFEDYKALRANTRLLRDEEVSEEECEEFKHERVVEDEGGVEKRGEERVMAMNKRLKEGFVNIDDFSWSKDYSTFSGQEEKYLRTPGPSFETEDPVEAFIAVWNKEIMDVIVKETNRYAWNKIAVLTEENKAIPAPLRSWTETSSEEIYRYFGVLIYMSVCNRSLCGDYWTTGIMGMPDFRRLMSRNRYLLLSRMLHFVNNDIHDPSLSSYERKILKIKPIVEHCNARFNALYTPSKHLSLDESLLLWKGRLSWVQCIRTKAARIGIKSYELCESNSGYLLRYLLYAGKNSTMRSEPLHGFENCTAKVVLELMDGFLDAGHTLVMDNWYNQLSLTRFLKRRGTDVIGTINSRSVHVPNAIKEANPKHMARGDLIARHCSDISLIAWKDVKLVTTVSTFHDNKQAPALRAGESILKPQVIIDYNKLMGGVDSKDQQLSMFLMERKRGLKWYIKVFKRLLNTSLLNTFIMFRNNATNRKKMSHRQFRLAVAQGLFQKFPKPDSAIRRNLVDPWPGQPRRLMKNVDHFVRHTELKGPNIPKKKQRRCVRCYAAGRRTMVTLMCTYCDVGLCPDTCWAEYHTLLKL